MRLRKWMANALFAVTTTFYFCCAQPALLEHEALPGAAASREEMAAFIDGFMAAQLKSHPFAGATVVVVVKDGALFFSKGYSFENIDNRVPVDPALTTAHHASAHHDAHRRIRRRNGSRDACRPGAAHSVNRCHRRWLRAYQSHRILKPETVALMHSRAMTRDPALNGHALGFMETVINGQRIVGHSGDTLRYHNALSLLPEAQWGLFVSVNTGGARESISDGGARRFCDSELLEFARIPLQLIRYSSRHEIFVALDSCSPS